MKKQYFTLILAIATTFFANAQFQSAPAEPHFCGQYAQQEKIYQIAPQQRIQDSIDGIAFEQDYQDYLATYDPSERSTYTIPIVIHVVHVNGLENITNTQIYDAIDRLNEDFSMTNSDVGNTYPAFAGIVGNGDIEFKLATKDPDGNCHSGITRTFSNTTYDTGMGGGGHPIVDAVAAQHGVWPQGQYMSIFVCIDPIGAAGYTYNPGNWFSPNEMYGAIFMRSDYMGVIGTSTPSRGHVLSHEAGHWLNLSHLWGSTNSPNVPSNCNADDGVADTPNTVGSQGCSPAAASCGSVDNVQNIMEYSSCRTMFSQGQVARMHTAVNSTTAGRNNLITNANLMATGVNVPGTICQANFIANETVICAGETVNFSDLSFHAVTSRSWTFAGGTPSTSVDSLVDVVYDTPGTYSVTIDVTDGATNVIGTKTNYIVVLENNGLSLPIQESFESITFPDNYAFFSSSALGINHWETTTNSAATGTKSIFYDNYGSGGGGAVVTFESGSIDLSTVDPSESLVFTFDYAYKKRNSTDDEWLKVFVSKDCGETWVQRKVLHGSILNNETSVANYIASPEDFKTVAITNINSSYYVSNFRYRFRFESDGGNNIYVDNINIVGESSLGINDINPESKINMYPNPALNELNVNIGSLEINSYRITTAGGQLILNVDQPMLGADRVLNIGTSQLSSGIYYVSFISENGIITEKFIKQ